MRSIKTYLTVALLLCMLLPAGLIGVTAYGFVFNSIKENRIEAVGQIADARYEELHIRLREDNERSKNLLDTLIAVCRYSDEGINACVRAKLEQFAAINHTVGLSFRSGIESDLAVGSDAIALDKLNPSLPGQIATISMLNGTSLFSLVAVDSASGFSLVTTYSGQQLQEIFVRSPVLGQSGEVFLADNQGFFITHPHYPSQQGINEPISAVPMQRCLRSENGEMLNPDYRNVPVIHGFRFVPDIGGGCIMAHVAQAEAFAPLTRWVMGLAIATLFLSCFAWLIAIMIGRGMTKPLVALADMARALSNGDFTQRVPSTSYSEIAELSNLFNSMAGQLDNTLSQLKTSEHKLEDKVVKRTAELHRQDKKYHSVIQSIGEGFWQVDKEGRLLEVNPAYARLSGYSEIELIGMQTNELEAQETPEETTEHIRKVIQQGSDTFETKHRRKDGSVWDVEVNASFISEDGEYFVAFFRDISERKRLELELRIAATAFESQEPMIITDANNIILQVNRAFTASTGYTKQEAVGQKISILKSGRHDAAFYAAMWESILHVGAWQGEIWDRRKNGDCYPKWLSITAVKGIDGVITHYVGTHTDITERNAAEQQIKQLAFYDPLTGLPNRRLLQERLKHGISVERREGKQLALLMLDLDRFKMVNDSLGHLAGDELLQQVAERITARLRDVDTVARLGGDEFVVLLEDITQPKDAARVAEDIIADLAKPFCLTQSDNIQIGASIGISLYPQHGDSPEMLMDHADAALYQAKDAGRGCFTYFSEELTIAARKRIALETRLRRALEQQELRVFFQPQVDIASGRIVGAEALVRWQDPTEGLIPPLRFIPIAEESSLIVEIGEWVLRETCRQGRQWLDAGLPPLILAVNVSSQQFSRSDISALVATVLSETGFPAKQLELEITETGLMENKANTTAILNNLRIQGVRIAIDDFGTGYSSLGYLKNFPLDVLKIDKSFIDDIAFHQDNMEIVATIVAMGHILGFKVLAEGVETAEQLAFLRAKGCDSYQGYIKSEAIPTDEFAELLRDQ